MAEENTPYNSGQKSESICVCYFPSLDLEVMTLTEVFTKAVADLFKIIDKPKETRRYGIPLSHYNQDGGRVRGEKREKGRGEEREEGRGEEREQGRGEEREEGRGGEREEGRGGEREEGRGEEREEGRGGEREEGRGEEREEGRGEEREEGRGEEGECSIVPQRKAI
ncbi:hypothetical protein SK128_003357 [Halocaridina rubra]|uniref:Uncharacterized protein n=1 Tax=Halocaridina rubra TaxID=373956 RepID=A0AAN9AH37_HALRR